MFKILIGVSKFLERLLRVIVTNSSVKQGVLSPTEKALGKKLAQNYYFLLVAVYFKEKI